MTIGSLVQSQNYNIFPKDSARLEIELLLSQVLRCERMYLYTNWDQSLNKKQIKQFQSLLELRKTGMPMAYILKKKEFYGCEFFIQQGVFIPRPETETLVSTVLSKCDHREKLKIIDFGCGSGCVGLSLLAYLPKAHLISIDLNEKALRISKINTERRGMIKRVTFLKKDISNLDTEKMFVNSKVDLIVANPPYIAFNDIGIENSVISFEPSEALFSKEQGMYHIRSWLKMASRLLKAGGMYFFEIGTGQETSSLKNEVDQMYKKATFKDLAGHVRIVQYQKYNG